MNELSTVLAHVGCIAHRKITAGKYFFDISLYRSCFFFDLLLLPSFLRWKQFWLLRQWSAIATKWWLTMSKTNTCSSALHLCTFFIYMHFFWYNNIKIIDTQSFLYYKQMKRRRTPRFFAFEWDCTSTFYSTKNTPNILPVLNARSRSNKLTRPFLDAKVLSNAYAARKLFCGIAKYESNSK